MKMTREELEDFAVHYVNQLYKDSDPDTQHARLGLLWGFLNAAQVKAEKESTT